MIDQKSTFDFSNPKLWVKVYLKALHDKRSRKLIFGSRNSAKSNFAAQYTIVRMLNEHTRGILVRKTYDSIKESQFETIKEIVMGYGYNVSSHFTFNVSPLKIECSNGNKLIARGMDKSDKAKSVRDPNFVWFEELDQLEYEDYKNTVLSIRGQGRKEHLGVFNPPPDDHWLVKNYLHDYEQWQRADGRHTYVRTDDPETMILHTNYLMNPHARQDFIREIEHLKQIDYNDYKVQGLGLIGQSRTGQEFFSFFNRDKHLSERAQFNPSLAVHVTFDYNKLPYSTCLLSHVMGRTIHHFDEVCLPPPENTIQDIEQTIRSRCPEIREMFIYGDPSGSASSQGKSRDESRSYTDAIRERFRRYIHNKSMRIVTSAPPLAGRRMAWMELMAGNSGYEVLINPRCTNIIKDMETLKIDDKGAWIKEKHTDKKTGQTFEKNGHCADAMTYQYAYLFPDLFYPKRFR